jgi:hypothetical protein
MLRDLTNWSKTAVWNTNIVASDSARDTEEHVFPCAPYHLRNVLAGAHFQTAGPAGYVMMCRCGNEVIAKFERAADSKGWTQVVAVKDIDESLLEAARLSDTYVA